MIRYIGMGESRKVAEAAGLETALPPHLLEGVRRRGRQARTLLESSNSM